MKATLKLWVFFFFLFFIKLNYVCGRKKSESKRDFTPQHAVT